MNKKHLFCFGLGYTALHLIEKLQGGDFVFSGTKRSSQNIADVEVHIFDEVLFLPQDITHILISIPPNEQGDLVYQTFAKQIANLPNLEWVGLLSTTGVYGDHNGDWVDEITPVNPQNARSKKRVLAENQWLELYDAKDIPLHIFRLSGIYGEDRNVMEMIKKNRATLIKDSRSFSSRIHVADIVQVLIASMQIPNAGNIYNIADDYPCPFTEVAQYVAELMGVNLPAPVDIYDESISPMRREFEAESRRIRNDKIKTELGVKLLYPTYKSFYHSTKQ